MVDRGNITMDSETPRPKEIRRPKPEGRKKAEIRNPKSEWIEQPAGRSSDFGLPLAFGFGVSAFGFPTPAAF
jgi:hypothetical protein